MTVIAPDKTLPSGRTTGTSRRTLQLSFGSAAAGAVVNLAANLATLPFVLHRIGPALYGGWVTIASLLAIGGLADAGVRTEIIRRVAAARGADDEEELIASVHQGVTLLAILLGFVVAVGMVGAPSIRSFAFPDGIRGYSPAEVDLLIRAILGLLAVAVLSNAYFSVLRGLQRTDVETVAQMLAVPAAAVTTVVGVMLGWGLWALFAGSLAHLIVISAWELGGTRRLVPALRLRLVRLTPATRKAYLVLSGLVLLSQVADVIDSQWDKIVLSRFVGSSAVASFQVGTSVVLQGKTLALLPLAPLLVAIAELRLRDRPRMEYLERLLAKGGMVLGAVTLSAIFVFAPSFIRLWLGPTMDATAGHAARLFAVAMALNLLAVPLAFRAFGEGWHRLAAIGSVVNMVVNASLSLALTMSLGFNGALYGSIAGNLAGTVVFLVLMRRKLGQSWVRPPVTAGLVGVLAAGAAIFFSVDQVNSWTTLALSAVAYAFVVGLAGAAAERIPIRTVLRPSV